MIHPPNSFIRSFIIAQYNWSINFDQERERERERVAEQWTQVVLSRCSFSHLATPTSENTRCVARVVILMKLEMSRNSTIILAIISSADAPANFQRGMFSSVSLYFARDFR